MKNAFRYIWSVWTIQLNVKREANRFQKIFSHHFYYNRAAIFHRVGWLGQWWTIDAQNVWRYSHYVTPRDISFGQSIPILPSVTIIL